MSNPKTISITGATADPDGISLSQTPSGAGNLTITGAFASGGVATLTPAGRVSITSGSNISNRTLTITGTDRNGYALVEAITGPNNATVYTLGDFKTVTQIAISGAAAGALTAGTNGVASTPWYVGDYRTGKLVMIGIALSTGAVLTYTVEYTMTNLNDQTLTTAAAQIAQAQNAVVYTSNDTNVVAASTKQVTNFINAPPGTRVTLNSWTSGTLSATFITASNEVA